jgi:DNA-binding transcriptional ArsR family regulator
VSPLAREIQSEIAAQPQQFSELVDAHRDVSWRELLHAWGELRAANILKRDDDGRYLIGQ